MLQQIIPKGISSSRFLDVEYISLETTEEFLTSASIQAITKDFLLFKEDNRHFSGKISFLTGRVRGLEHLIVRDKVGKNILTL